MRKKYRVTLIPEERARSRKLISSDKTKARKLTRARILLKADEAEGGPDWDDRAIS